MRKVFFVSILVLLIFSVSMASAERMVLMELFTSTTCPPCVGANGWLNDWYPDHYDEVSIIRYHVWWPSPGNDPFYLANVAENTTRTNYYGVTGVPNMRIDGVIDGGSSYPWENLVYQRLPIPNPVELEVFGSYNWDTRQGEAVVNVTAVDDVDGSDIRFFFVVIENDISYTGPNGDPIHHQVMRDMIPGATGEAFDIENGETVSFTRSFTIDDEWEAENCEIVCFVQDYSGREIHQSYHATLDGLVPPAAIEGYVTDCDSEEGLDVTRVYVEDTNFTTVTDADGFYHLNLEPGTHTVTYERFGYDMHTEEVTVAEDDLLPIDVCLNAFEQSTLHGVVSELETDNPIAGAPVELLDVPIGPTITDENGMYSFTVPGGYTYDVSVYADDREPQVQSVEVPESQDITLDFPMRFVESFEASDGDFTADMIWEWGEANEEGGSAEAYMGVNYWATNIDGPYPGNRRANLYSPVYDLTGVDTPELHYAHWLNFNDGWDGYQVAISVDAGDNWTDIVPVSGYSHSSVVGLGGRAGFSGESEGWQMVDFDLSEYAGESSVQFRFRLGTTNNSRDYLGACIDYFDLNVLPPQGGDYSVSGTVLYRAAELPMINTDLMLGSFTAMTDANGDYMFTSIPGDNYELTAMKEGGANGISTFDAARVAQYAAGMYDFDEYEVIAADVTGNGDVGTFDAAKIAQYSAGMPHQSLTGEWMFMPDMYEYSPLQMDMTGQDFTGILYGEVTGNWNVETPVFGKTDAAEVAAAPVQIEDGVVRTSENGVIAFQFVVESDQALSAILAKTMPADWQLVINQTSENSWFVGGYGVTEVSDALVELNDGVSIVSGQINERPIKVTDEVAVPENVTLSANYPNPFNPTTAITYAVPVTQEVRLSVYNLSGQLVTMLVNDVVSAGEYTVKWNGLDDNGASVASGTYIYQLETDTDTITRTMVLLK